MKRRADQKGEERGGEAQGWKQLCSAPPKNKGWLPSLNPQISRYPNNTPWEADL